MNNSTYHLSIRETLTSAWSKVYGSITIFWGAFFYVIVISLLFNLIQHYAPNSKSIEMLGVIVNFILIILEYGLFYMGIRRANDLPIVHQQVFRGFDRQVLLKIILFTLLVTFIILVLLFILIFLTVSAISLIYSSPPKFLNNLILLMIIIVFIYFTIRTFMSYGLIVDKELGAWQAFKKSFVATRGNFWRLLALFIITILIMMVSALPLGIGLIWTIPFAFIVYGEIYKRLLVKANL